MKFHPWRGVKEVSPMSLHFAQLQSHISWKIPLPFLTLEALDLFHVLMCHKNRREESTNGCDHLPTCNSLPSLHTLKLTDMSVWTWNLDSCNKHLTCKVPNNTTDFEHTRNMIFLKHNQLSFFQQQTKSSRESFDIFYVIFPRSIHDINWLQKICPRQKTLKFPRPFEGKKTKKHVGCGPIRCHPGSPNDAHSLPRNANG